MSSQKGKFLLIALSAVISIAVIYYRNSLSSLAGYGYLGIFLISVIGNATVILPAPVIITAFLGGGIFNPYLVGVISAIGATIGEITGYMAGYGGQAVIKKDARYTKIESWVKKRGFLTLLILAAIPNPLFDVAGIISGITNYPFMRFFTATLIGKTVKFVVVALIGAASIGKF